MKGKIEASGPKMDPICKLERVGCSSFALSYRHSLPVPRVFGGQSCSPSTLLGLLEGRCVLCWGELKSHCVPASHVGSQRGFLQLRYRH